MPDYDPQQVAQRLDTRQQEIERRREELHRNGDGLTDELADYDQHPADQGTETFEQELDETTIMILEEEERRGEEARQGPRAPRQRRRRRCGEGVPGRRLRARPPTLRRAGGQRLRAPRPRRRGRP